MELPPSSGLSEDAKDRIISEQAAMISQLARRISELEKLVGKPKKTSKNSSKPPSSDGPGKANKPKRAQKKRAPRIGKARALTENPIMSQRVV
jgi:transposase